MELITYRLYEVPARVRSLLERAPQTLSVLADLLVTQHDHGAVGVTCIIIIKVNYEIMYVLNRIFFQH